MIKSKDTLKTYFETGNKPTEEEFIDLIDSLATENHTHASMGVSVQRVERIIEVYTLFKNTPGLKAEIDALFSGESNGKKLIEWEHILSKPNIDGDIKELIRSYTRLSKVAGLKAEIDALFSGESNGKKRIEWEHILSKPNFEKDIKEAIETYTRLSKVAGLKTEIDAFFDGESNGKKQINWANITQKPTFVNADQVKSTIRSYTRLSTVSGLKTEISNLFDGESNGKKQVHWNHITHKPTQKRPSYLYILGHANDANRLFPFYETTEEYTVTEMRFNPASEIPPRRGEEPAPPMILTEVKKTRIIRHPNTAAQPNSVLRQQFNIDTLNLGPSFKVVFLGHNRYNSFILTADITVSAYSITIRKTRNIGASNESRTATFPHMQIFCILGTNTVYGKTTTPSSLVEVIDLKVWNLNASNMRRSKTLVITYNNNEHYYGKDTMHLHLIPIS